MKKPMRLLVMLLLMSPAGFPCTCLPGGGNACRGLADTRAVIFVGRVVVDSGARFGNRPARLEVEEILRGLPIRQKFVDVNSSYGNSCHIRLRRGQRYVVFAGRDEDNSNLLFTSVCSSTFSLEGKEHILEAMRNALAAGAPRLVGTVLRATGKYSHGDGVEGATVSLEMNGVLQTVSADAQGNYVFYALTPGRYRVTVSRPGFVPDDDYNNRWSGIMRLDPTKNAIVPDNSPRGTVEILQNSCEIWDLGMWADGRISGTVRDEDGNPVAEVPVQVFGIDRRWNDLEITPLRIAVTDDSGWYVIDRLPPGEYAVAVNGQEDNDSEPYPPTFYPSESNRTRAPRLAVKESQELKGIDLTLPPKREPLQILVHVIDIDGNPLQGVRVRLLDRDGIERSHSRPDSNEEGRVTLNGYLGEEYSVKAYHSKRLSRVTQWLEGTAHVYANKTEPTVLILRPTSDPFK